MIQIDLNIGDTVVVNLGNDRKRELSVGILKKVGYLIELENGEKTMVEGHQLCAFSVDKVKYT